MNTKTITPSEIESLRISALPTRPTAPGYFGGRGYTAKDMKNAFDRLPLFIVDRLNSLIEDMGREGEGSLVAHLPTGIAEAPHLSDLLADITSGELTAYLSLGAESLGKRMQRLAENEERVDGLLDFLILHTEDKILDAASPSARDPVSGEVKA